MKNGNKKLAAKILLMLTLGLYNTMSTAYAFPSQGTFDNSKAASITASDNMMTITGKGKNNILNWANFQIGKNETVKFNDKNNYLNLVHGVDISRIYGTLSGGNIVYLVNPNGILFGQGTKLDNVGSFVASTRNVSSINKEAFLQDPSNTAAVLGTDNPVMDNKDYYPEDSTYVPKISVAEMQLTNVPASATSIILDGPGGVILKNTELLDQATQVTTRKDGGEIGIGSDDGTVVLTDAQKEKIALINGDKAYAYEDGAGVLQGYQTVKNMDEFVAMDTVVRGEEAKNYMLVNDIDASDVVDYKSINGKGVFEGMGYYLSNLKVAEFSRETFNYKGVFGKYEGDIRNSYINNISFDGLGDDLILGGLVGRLDGNSSISNVHVSGSIDGVVEGSGYIGGLIGFIMPEYETVTEIRNSGSNIEIDINIKTERPIYIGGIVGQSGVSAAESTGKKIMISNAYNTGNIKAYLESYSDGSAGDLVGENEDYKGTAIAIGGIIGTSHSATRTKVQNIYATGDLLLNYKDLVESKSLICMGGVIGCNRYNDVSVGDVYNFGSLSFEGNVEDGRLFLGGILGLDPRNGTNYIVDMHGKTLKSYYVQNAGNCEYDTNFGEEKTPSEMLNLFDKVMIGAYDFSKHTDDVTSGVPDVGEVVPPSDPVNPKPDNPVEPKPDTPIKPSINTGINQDKFYEVVDDKEYNNLMNEVKDVKAIVNKNTYWDGSGFEPEIKYSVSFSESMSWEDRITKGETVYRLEPNIQDDGYKELDGNMYMENWKTSAVNENGYCKVTFDVYNRESVSGVVEVYDANGNRIKTVWIEPFRKYAESIKETAYDIGKIFTGELDAKKTSIEVDVPVGGYFRITNNENNSPSLKLHTYIIDAIDNTEDFISMVRQIDDRILDILTEDRVKNVFADAIIEVVDNRLVEVALDKGVDYYTMGIYEVVDEVINDVLSGEGRNLVFKAIADKFKQELNAKGIVEAIFWQVLDDAGQFTEPVREFLFSINMCLNEIKEGAAKNNTEHARATNFIVGY